jgi:hypothetical protein
MAVSEQQRPNSSGPWSSSSARHGSAYQNGNNQRNELREGVVWTQKAINDVVVVNRLEVPEAAHTETYHTVKTTG